MKKIWEHNTETKKTRHKNHNNTPTHQHNNNKKIKITQTTSTTKNGRLGYYLIISSLKGGGWKLDLEFDLAKQSFVGRPVTGWRKHRCSNMFLKPIPVVQNPAVQNEEKPTKTLQKTKKYTKTQGERKSWVIFSPRRTKNYPNLVLRKRQCTWAIERKTMKTIKAIIIFKNIIRRRN